MMEGSDICLIAIGSTVYPAPQAAHSLRGLGVRVGVVNARFLKPLDAELILSVAGSCGRVMTVEENLLQGGFGSAVLELVNDNNMQDVIVRRLGIPDRFVEHGSQARLRQDLGIDAEGIASAALAFLKQ